MRNYKVVAGPEAYLPPAAATMGVELPDEGGALIEGSLATEEEALEHAAKKFLEAKVPTLFPGPLVLWNWRDGVEKKAKAVRDMFETLKEVAIPGQRPMLIPMPDYRPKYPKIDAETEINPNHPNLTIWHNKIDVCMFVGVHCHFANISLKIIRGETNCYTVAMCAQHGHEDAMMTFRDASADKINQLSAKIRELAGK
ncbi:MAG: carbon monoxide dehydrogenase [Spirochaetota bacterium]|nr:carbon monoxide dehydrogenase [Spirochaetota bacterium]